MEAYIVEWLNLLTRWLHFIVGIAWVGSSFYFVWLDNHLLPVVDEADTAKGVGGEIWSVHGGGFYHAQKYRLAPKTLPATLHWFKWEAYTTWMSGMFLLALVYWYGAEVYLVDISVFELSKGAAIGIGAAFLVGGWLVYDLLCKSPLAKNDALLGGIIFVLLVAAAWGLCQLFSGRGAYIHFGALIGTIMVANVFFVIIPGQKRMVRAASVGGDVSPMDGINGKQRSVHNTYFTLPVLFVMISNHYAMTYGHEYNWLILIAIGLAGALIRVYFVARHKGNPSVLWLVLAGLIIATVAAAIVPRPVQSTTSTAVGTGTDNASVVGEPSHQVAGGPSSFADVAAIIQARCTACHSATPTYAGFPAAPGGVVFDKPMHIVRESRRIHQQSVVTQIMPIGNLTNMREEERIIVDKWFRSGASVDWIEEH